MFIIGSWFPESKSENYNFNVISIIIEYTEEQKICDSPSICGLDITHLLHPC